MGEIVYRTEARLELKASNVAEVSATIVAIWTKGKGNSISLREGSQTVHLDKNQLEEIRSNIDSMIGDLS